MKIRSTSPGNAVRRLVVLIALAILAFGSNNVFAQTPVSLNVARQGHTATVLADGRVLVFGGDAAGSTEATAEIVDVAAGKSTNVALNGIAARTGHTATRLADGRVLIAGGSESGVPVSSTFFIDAAGNASPGPNMASARSGHTAVYFSGTNNVLFIGGDSTGTAEVLDVAAGTSQHAPSNMSTPRSGHSSVLMNDGRVLVAGGDGLNTAEIFDGSSFTATGNAMTLARSGALLRTLPDGKVQIIGGNSDGSMEVYDPAIDTIGAYAHVIPSTDTCLSLQTGVKSSQTRAALFGANVNYGAPFDRTGAAIVELGSQALIIGGSNGGTAITPIASSNATVTTDKLDYAPGETATIKGTGFGANETVNIVIHEDPKPSATHVERKLTATSDAAGNFTISYQVEVHDASLKFILNARGATSGFNAQTTFTDGNVKWSISPSGATATITESLYASSSTCSGSLRNGYPKSLNSDSDTVGVGNNESLRLDAPATNSSGQSFVGWSSPDSPASPFTIIAGTNNRSICIPGFQSGTRNYIATYAGNTPPVANPQSVTTNEDTPVGITLNATDADGNTLTYSVVTGPTQGSLSGSAPNLTYTPAANYNGPDSFTFKANDGTADSNIATVSITVTAVNDAPVAVDDTATTNEDTPKTFTQADLKGNDTDVDNSNAQLTVTAVSNPTNGTVGLAGGIVTFTPTADFSGTAGFDYTVSDGPLSDVGHVTITVVAVNDAPVCSPASGSTAEDTALNGNLSCTDVEGNSLTYSKVADPAHGTVTVNANGSFTYTPNANYNGPDSFTFKANDGTIDSNVATFSITVTAVNDAPTATNDSHTVAEDNVLTITAPGVLGNDADLDGDSLTAVLDTGVTKGSLSLNTNGSFSYTPNADYCGSDSFTYHANDGTANSNVATVSISVTCVNDNPVAQNDSATVNEDSGANAIDVLANDNDGVDEGETLTIAAVTQPSHGTVTFTATGVSYTPAANYNGPDSFTYTISDGNGGSATATVSVTVNNVNDAPVAAPDSYNATEDTTLTVAAPGVLGNDTDIDSGDTSTAVLVSTTAHGTLTLNPDGSFSYTPSPNFCGDDSFTYKANDGDADSNPATVSITVACVNDGPVAVDDEEAETDEDTPLTLAPEDLTANDTDVENSALTVTGVSGATNGTVQFVGGSITFTPAANYFGIAGFDYVVSDGTATDTGHVKITVRPINDRPVIDLNGPDVVDEQETQGINFATTFTEDGGSIAVVFLHPSDSTKSMLVDDIDSTTLTGATVTIVDRPDGIAEVLAVNTTPVDPDTNTNITTSITANYDPNTGILTLMGTDTLEHYQAVLRTVTYENTSQNPSVDDRDIEFVVNDGTATNQPVAVTTVKVKAVNDAPVAAADAYTTDEDTALTVNAPGVLMNDTDAEANALTAIEVSAPVHGTLALNADGSFTYTPDANYNGSDSFTYKANDGTVDSDAVTVTITIKPVNDTPEAQNDSDTTNEDTAVTTNVLANDSDVDGDTLTITAYTQGTNGSVTCAGGSCTYTPNLNFNGTDSYSYTIDDGHGATDTATVNITITPVNDAPVAVADSTTTPEDIFVDIDVIANDTDVDNNNVDLSVNAIANVVGGTAVLQPGGRVVRFTPNANANNDNTPGGFSFTYTAKDSDNAVSNAVTVSISVTPVNDAPVAQAASFNTDEDTPYSGSVSANDVDSNALTYSIEVAAEHGTVAISPSTGAFTYTPALNYFGPDSFTFKACDEEPLCSTAVVSITVNPVNDAPVAVGDSYSVNEDTLLSPAAPGVLSNDTDVDGPAMSAVLVSGPTNASTFALNTDGSFSYQGAANFNGSDSFTYKANDGSLDSNVVTVSITVVAVNDAPAAANDSATTLEDTAVDIDLITNDSDVDNANTQLTVASISSVQGGTAVLLPDNRTIRFTPAANLNNDTNPGGFSFTYVAQDVDGALSNSASVSISVTPVNDSPVAQPGSFSTDEDTTYNGNAMAADIDSSNLTYSVFTNPQHGTVSIDSATGAFIYTPAQDYFGSDNFIFRVCDDGNLCSTAVISITVNAVNDAPVASADAYSIDEDTLLSETTPGVLANDTDVDGPSINAVLVEGPANSSSFALNADGSFTYQGAANFNGTDSFKYKANDETLDSNVVIVTITVNAVNDPPVAEDDSAATDEDTPIDIDVKANDSDIEGDPLSAQIATPPTKGTITANGDGTFRYTPNPNYYGSDSFTYTVSDGTNTSAPATVTVTVRPVNDAPVGVTDSYSTAEDTPINAAAPGVLGNDTDIEENTLTATLLSGPSHASSFTLNADGSFSYTPALNFNGPDSFTYKACDNGQSGSPLSPDPECSGSVTVNISVAAVNDAPVITAMDIAPAEINENGTATLTATFTDVDSAGFTLTINWGDGSGPQTVTCPTAGSCSFAAGTSNVSISHQYLDDNPSSTTSDTNAVTLLVSDGSDSDTETDSIKVHNVNPIITTVTGPPAPIAMGSTATVTANFTDVGSKDGHSCEFSWDDSTPNTTVTAAGTGNGSCSANHAFTAPGVYTVGVTVTDDDTGSASTIYEFVVAYDPEGGFVTGGGWIDSPAGASLAFPTAIGKANFGFVSKYKKGTNVPEGQTEFQFKAGDLNFHSSAYDAGSLIVQNFKAQYRGTGTVNGQPGYKFVLTAYDGQVSGGGGTDKFRMKITRDSDNAVIYDNRRGTSDDMDIANPMVISGGSIVIHSKGGK